MRLILHLIILAITFYFQVQAFRERSSMQWILLIVIGIVGLTSYLLSKQMKKEQWFLEMQKRKSR